MRISPIILGVLLAIGVASSTYATEIGEALRAAGLEPQAAPHGFLRVDSLAEDFSYSTPYRDYPQETWSPLDHRFRQWLPPLPAPDFSHQHPDDPNRHIGIGWPLEGTSWRNRPFHIGWLFGGVWGDSLVDHTLKQDRNYFGGYRAGWDFDHYWGTEARVAFANLDVTASRLDMRLPSARNGFADISLLYYPWGDARWRPYASMGFGWAEFSYFDEQRRLMHDQSVTMPLSIGLKYYWKKWFSVRTALTDNIAFSSNRVDTMHSLSLTVGIEYRMGPRRRIYSSW